MFYESDVERTIIESLVELGYSYVGDDNEWVQERKLSDFINEQVLMTQLAKINKGVNPLKVKGKTATVKASKVKKKNQKLAVSKVIKFTKKGQGKKVYKLVSAKKGGKNFKKYFTVNKKNGKLTVKKGLKKKGSSGRTCKIQAETRSSKAVGS